MARVRFSQENLEYLRQNYLLMCRKDLTEAYNKTFGTNLTETQIVSALKNNKIQGGGYRNSSSNRKYSDDHLEFLRQNYPLMQNRAELLQAFNLKFEMQVTTSQLEGCLKNNKITSGRTGHFSQGHVSWNALMKGTGAVKSNSGSFKKGQTPLNVKPLGHERVTDGFILIKIAEHNPHTGAPTRYKHKHIHIWEQANGKVPEGMALVFVDGNPMNCCLENLTLVTRQELLRLNKNGYKNAPDEFKPVIMTLSKLESVTFKLKQGGI